MRRRTFLEALIAVGAGFARMPDHATAETVKQVTLRIEGMT